MSSIIYEMIIFDWDGTAVPDRHSPIGELKTALEEVLKEGALCAIVTGTNLDNIIKQGIGELSTLAKHGLHVCTNRGSEVYAFDADGKPKLIFRRQATQSENRALDAAATLLHDRIKAQGMQTEITFNRLNRRKVDLIPEPEWSSPKKAQFRELLAAVEKRLCSSGIKGGIAKLILLGEEIAHQAGLSTPKITSDIKHIEIGLTDKGDSATWVARSLIGPDKLPLSKVSVWGDEFGSLGNLPGSDALMRTPDLQKVSFFSVGIEPEGVPDWVHSLGGGPARFIQFLLDQARLRREVRNISDTRPSEECAWVLEQKGFDPSRERLMETLFAISNGNLGIRGTSDIPIPAAQADLFIAGIYDQRVPSQPYSEVELFDSSDASPNGLGSKEVEIVPLPFPFRFRCQIDGEPIRAESSKRVEHRRILDLKKGIYFEDNLIESSQGQKTKISSLRICSIVDPNLLIQKTTFSAENYSGHLDIDLSLYPEELAELYPHLRAVENESQENLQCTELQQFKTIGSNDSIVLVSRIVINGREIKSPHLSTDLSLGENLVIERTVNIFSGRDSKKVVTSAIAHSKSLPLGLVPNMDQHLKEWERFWSDADIRLSQAPGPNDALRFNLYHLKSSAALTPQTSVPAKALTGRAYEGHIFWDTEIFILPFFLYTNPGIARELLMYRYNTLNGARKRASKDGFRGASYAWESTETGEDVTPGFLSISGKTGENGSKIPIFTGTQELHITADIAWAVFKYWDATLDQHFMRDYGVEILIETARFWVSRVELSGNHYHLKGVVGPDEYHHGVTDNAFTNWMVRFNLEVSIRLVNWLLKEHYSRFQELSSKLNFHLEEISDWQDVYNRLLIPQAGEHGVIEQYEGFFALTPVELSPKEKNRAPISRLFDWEKINQTRITKQADVLMIPFLFPDQLSAEVIKANYDYYDPITDQGSSLSPCIHAAIAARVGKMEDALRYWRESLYFDLHNTMSNSQLGIHAAALGGTWQALVFHLLGVRLSESGWSYDKNALLLIPKEWGDLEMKLKYRNRTYSLILKSGKLFEIGKEAA